MTRNRYRPLGTRHSGWGPVAEIFDREYEELVLVYKRDGRLRRYEASRGDEPVRGALATAARKAFA